MVIDSIKFKGKKNITSKLKLKTNAPELITPVIMNIFDFFSLDIIKNISEVGLPMVNIIIII